MNLIVSLQKKFGSKETKVKAINFEIQRLQEEIEYHQELGTLSTDYAEKEYHQLMVTNFEYKKMSKQLEIERLQK